jgi:hypothetical protein
MKHPTKRGKEEQREIRPKVKTKSAKIQMGSQKGKGTNYVSKPPSVARSIWKKENFKA